MLAVVFFALEGLLLATNNNKCFRQKFDRAKPKERKFLAFEVFLKIIRLVSHLDET